MDSAMDSQICDAARREDIADVTDLIDRDTNINHQLEVVSNLNLMGIVN